MTRPLTARQVQTEKVTQQVAEVADRLCREFAPAGGTAADVVREHVREVQAGYGSPRVLTYLSLLVERDVRRCLRARPTAAPA